MKTPEWWDADRKKPNGRKGITGLPLCPEAQKTEVGDCRHCFHVKMGEKTIGLQYKHWAFVSCKYNHCR